MINRYFFYKIKIAAVAQHSEISLSETYLCARSAVAAEYDKKNCRTAALVSFVLKSTRNWESGLRVVLRVRLVGRKEKREKGNEVNIFRTPKVQFP